MVDIGTDIKSDWEFTDDGDLLIITGEDNLKQSVLNRFSIYDGTFRWFYAEYGSVLSNYFGFRKDNTTLEFMKIELERVLLQDPRIQGFDLQLSYVETGVKVELTINLDDANVEMNFVTDGTTITIQEEEE